MEKSVDNRAFNRSLVPGANPQHQAHVSGQGGDEHTRGQEKLNKDVKFYFGGQKTPKVAQRFGEFTSNKKPPPSTKPTAKLAIGRFSRR